MTGLKGFRRWKENTNKKKSDHYESRREFCRHCRGLKIDFIGKTAIIKSENIVLLSNNFNFEKPPIKLGSSAYVVIYEFDKRRSELNGSVFVRVTAYRKNGSFVSLLNTRPQDDFTSDKKLDRGLFFAQRTEIQAVIAEVGIRLLFFEYVDGFQH